jgi:hypothetical protein
MKWASLIQFGILSREGLVLSVTRKLAVVLDQTYPQTILLLKGIALTISKRSIQAIPERLLLWCWYGAMAFHE